MEMDLNNRLTEDETLEQAYDIFLELAADKQEHVDFDLNPDFFAEVVIGLADTEDGEINDIFARVLLCREKDHKLCHILWRE
ncbi:DUF440 family protein [Salmonella enterica]|nr:DUF440 family protein [Salmonella enterica]